MQVSFAKGIQRGRRKKKAPQCVVCFALLLVDFIYFIRNIFDRYFGSHSLSGCVLRRSLEAPKKRKNILLWLRFWRCGEAVENPNKEKQAENVVLDAFEMYRAMMENSFGDFNSPTNTIELVLYFLFKNQFYADEIFMEKLLHTHTDEEKAENFPLRARFSTPKPMCFVLVSPYFRFSVSYTAMPYVQLTQIFQSEISLSCTWSRETPLDAKIGIALKKIASPPSARADMGRTILKGILRWMAHNITIHCKWICALNIGIIYPLWMRSREKPNGKTHFS